MWKICEQIHTLIKNSLFVLSKDDIYLDKNTKIDFIFGYSDT